MANYISRPWIKKALKAHVDEISLPKRPAGQITELVGAAAGPSGNAPFVTGIVSDKTHFINAVFTAEAIQGFEVAT